MSSLPENLENLKRTAGEFLMTDLEAALTFLDVAATSGNQETVARNHQNARTAYDSVLKFLAKLTLTTHDRQAVETKLNLLRLRLKAGGYEL